VISASAVPVGRPSKSLNTVVYDCAKDVTRLHVVVHKRTAVFQNETSLAIFPADETSLKEAATKLSALYRGETKAGPKVIPIR
jgi:hypothetical protein